MWSATGPSRVPRRLDEVPLSTMFSPTYDDGTSLYGVVAGGSQVATLDPHSDADPGSR